jgi:hypothetical protein
MFTVYVRSDGQTDTQEFSQHDTEQQARQEVENIMLDYGVVTRTELENLSEARTRLEVDGRFVSAWRCRIDGADGFDTVAIVQQP